MDVSFSKATPEFIPVEMKITFLNQGELDLFTSLIGNDCSLGKPGTTIFEGLRASGGIYTDKH